MDVFSNVLEGTRQYFMGLPKPAIEGTGWTAPAPSEEPAPAQSGAPTPTAPPPSAAAAPPPPRPPSEPIEPEPHIIHKATVMREAAEKRRERAEPEDDDEASSALSPPPHIIRRPQPEPAMVPVSPAPRPPSKAPTPIAPSPETPTSRGSTPHSATPIARPPEHFTPSRPPDPYSSSRPPEPYPSQFYEPTHSDGRVLSTQPSPQPPPRHNSPQSYARMSSSLPTHASRLRDIASQSLPAQRYPMSASSHPPPPPHNDRVPPIHHPPGPETLPAPSVQRVPVADARSQYQPVTQRREPSPYSHPPHYEHHPTLPQRKYDYQHTYPGYRPSATVPQPVSNHRVESHPPLHFKHGSVDAMSSHYPARPMERVPAPSNPYPHETIRRADYPGMARTATDARSGYHYPSPSTSSARYAPTTPTVVAPVVQSSTIPPRPVHCPAATSKRTYDVHKARAAIKPGLYQQQLRKTVSVTTLVNQMNQTKQKRESPLDLSVKTVKNSADSSTTQDDLVDSATGDKNLPLQIRPSSSSQLSTSSSSNTNSHKVDFAPNFTQYRERNPSHTYPAPTVAPVQQTVRYNGAYEARRPAPDGYNIESRHHVYPDRAKYNMPVARAEYVSRIDLTRPVIDERRTDNRIRDDRNFIIESDRKRPSGPIVSNIPEKIVKYETWTSDSRIDRISQSAREQQELMSQPVYSYSSHKQFEAYQIEQRRLAASGMYRDNHLHHHVNHRYPYHPEIPLRDRHAHHSHHHDRNQPATSRQVIQKIPSHRDIPPHHYDVHGGVPANKRVLSLLRDSLESKQTGIVQPSKSAKQIPDLIVIDDVDDVDSVIEITDLTKDNETEVPLKITPKPLHNFGQSVGHYIQMPKAVDSLAAEYQNADSRSPPEVDVASRIRTKAELKGLPPSDSATRIDLKQDMPVKIVPKSQKQHLFNQIREDQILESVIKNEKHPDTTIPEVKSEPMSIDEIEQDAVEPLQTDSINLPGLNMEMPRTPEPEDLDWASACDSFMEQLKTSTHKKKIPKKRSENVNNESSQKILQPEPVNTISTINAEPLQSTSSVVIIKQEPIDQDDKNDSIETTLTHIEYGKEDKLPQIEESHENIVQKKKMSPTKVENNKKCSLESETKKAKSKTDKSLKPNKIVKDRILLSQEKKILSDKDKQTISEQENKQSSSDIDTTPLSLELKLKNDQAKTKKLTLGTPEKEKVKKAQQNEKSKFLGKTRKPLTPQEEKDKNKDKKNHIHIEEKETTRGRPKKSITEGTNKLEKESNKSDKANTKNKSSTEEISEKDKKLSLKGGKNKVFRKNNKSCEKSPKDKQQKVKKGKVDNSLSPDINIKKEIEDDLPLNVCIKKEPESTDDDEPLIKSKIQKEKDMKYQLLKDLSEKSAYVKLECFDVDLNKNTRISIDSLTKEKDEKQPKGKVLRQVSKGRERVDSDKTENQNDISCSNSEDEDHTVAKRLRVRRGMKTDETSAVNKTPVKSSSKKQETLSISSCSTPLRKSGFGDGSDFRPGWEEELYKYKRSLRMPTRLIAIPRGRSGGPFVKRIGASFNRGSTSLPDLDPAPLSPAPSSAATDDLYARRPDKLTVDSDLESNSSYSATNRLQYDSEASTSTVFSSTLRKKTSSIVDVLIQKCGKHEGSKKKSKDKEKDDKTAKIIPKSSNLNELLPTPSLGLVKNGNKGILSAKKEKLMEDIFYLGAFRKETVNAYRNAFIKNTDGLIGATEEFAPVVLKSRTRTESRVLKQRATIKEVFGDERPASAPPTSCREDEPQEIDEPNQTIAKIDKEIEPDTNVMAKPKLKSKKIIKDKLKRRSSSIRDGLRSTKSLKRNDAKGRLLRLKKRNSLMKSFASKRMKDQTNKIKKDKPEGQEENEKSKDDNSVPGTVEGSKRRFKRLFGRRKFSSGFDYIKKKKKVMRREETPNNRVPPRRAAVKPSPESVHDIQKEIKSWFINKSVGETPLHRAARLGYTDCVAYCLEKMEADPSAKDNAGFTPLHVASAKGHVRIARLLLQYGANVSAAATGGIRPLHEACENCHVEVIRLLLAYGADPLLGTYAGQTPEQLAEGPAALLLRLHIADVQGRSIEPWRFPPPADVIDREELGCDPLCSPPPGSPPPPPDTTIEMQCTEFPLPPFYSFKTQPGQPSDGFWCLLNDVTNLLQIKSKDSLLKQIHCGSGSPKELLKEIRTQEFLERTQCHQLVCSGEKLNIRASKVALVRVTDKLRQLLKIETVLIS